MNNDKPQSDKQTKDNNKQKAPKKKNFLDGKKCIKDPMEFFEDEE